MSIETIRPLLRRTGFGGRRTRYVPAKRPDPHEYADAPHDWAWLKRGLCSPCGSNGLWTKQDGAEPTSSWCAVKQPVGVPKRSGKPSRVNVMGALGRCGGQGQRAWQFVEGTVKAAAFVAWLEP